MALRVQQFLKEKIKQNGFVLSKVVLFFKNCTNLLQSQDLSVANFQGAVCYGPEHENTKVFSK